MPMRSWPGKNCANVRPMQDAGSYTATLWVAPLPSPWPASSREVWTMERSFWNPPSPACRMLPPKLVFGAVWPPF